MLKICYDLFDVIFMEKEKRNQLILIFTVILLLIGVIGIFVYIILDEKKTDKVVSVKINQIYSSEYNLKSIGDFYLGMLNENAITTVIDNEGKEVIHLNEEIYFDNYFKMADDRYLIYSNKDNNLITYLFDGKKIDKYYEIKDVGVVSPLVYNNGMNKYIISFISYKKDGLYLYSLDNSGIAVVDNVVLLPDYSNSDVYYTFNDNYLPVLNNKGKAGVVNLLGEVVIDFKYDDIANTYNNTFIVEKNKKYGIVGADNKVLVDIKYKGISLYQDGYLLINEDNKMALFDSKLNRLTKYKMDYNDKEFNLRYDNGNFVKKSGDYYVVANNYLEDVNDIEYNKHNLYVVSNSKITKNIKEIGFGIGDVYYSYDDNYKVTIYNGRFEKKFDFVLDDAYKINNIEYVNDDIVRVNYITEEGSTKHVYVSAKGKEDFDLGTIIYKGNEFALFVTTNGSSNIIKAYDSKLNELSQLECYEYEVIGDYIIADNAIYHIEYKS